MGLVGQHRHTILFVVGTRDIQWTFPRCTLDKEQKGKQAPLAQLKAGLFAPASTCIPFLIPHPGSCPGRLLLACQLLGPVVVGQRGERGHGRSALEEREFCQRTGRSQTHRSKK